MKSSKKTIKDLAEELGVSKSTISRALSDSHEVSEATKRRVKELAAKWHFQPNPQARSLKGKKSFLLGVVVPEIAHKFFSSAIAGIQEVVLDKGYNVLICQSNESAEREIEVVSELISTYVDGIILSLAHDTTDLAHVKAAQESGIPVVLFDRTSKELNCSKVVIDHQKAAYYAVRHLIEQGCKRIAHLSGSKTLNISQARTKGYLQAIRKFKLEEDKSLIIENGYNPARTPDIIKELFASDNVPDGISCFNDDVAVAVIRTLKRLGFDVPRQVKVIGFNDEPVCEIVEPGLSTVNHPSRKMGEEAARLFLHQIENLSIDYMRTVMLETNLVVRDSTLSKR